MDVRDATHDDLPALLVMAEKFADAAFGDKNIPFDETSCLEVGRALIDDGILLVTDDLKGMIGIFIIPLWFNRNFLNGSELFWWCENGYGNALREEGERRARAMGASTMSMSCEDRLRSKAVDRLYRMKGYEIREHSYLKELV